jgi:uncharacterized membrane protein
MPSLKSQLNTILPRLAERLGNDDTRVPDLDDLTKDARNVREQRADQLAAIIGTWKFIAAEVVIGVLWVIANSSIWTVDKFPFPFLGVALTGVAALATPLILMSQNRQALTDRLAAEAARHYAMLAVALVKDGVVPKLDTLTELVEGKAGKKAGVLQKLDELKLAVGKPDTA